MFILRELAEESEAMMSSESIARAVVKTKYALLKRPVALALHTHVSICFNLFLFKLVA